MGRELRRVPLDFKHTLNQVWDGYINPHWRRQSSCEWCRHTGYNLPTRVLYDSLDSWRTQLTQEEIDYLLSDDGHIFSKWDHEEKKWVKPESLTAEEVNERSSKDFMYLFNSRYQLVKARATIRGFYGLCDKCEGEGRLWASPQAKKDYDAWEPIPPPKGDGYQLWETTSEGSPVSPVFKTLDELCEWCATGATTFGSFRASKEDWKKMLDDGMVHHREGNMVFI